MLIFHNRKVYLTYTWFKGYVIPVPVLSYCAVNTTVLEFCLVQRLYAYSTEGVTKVCAIAMRPSKTT